VEGLVALRARAFRRGLGCAMWMYNKAGGWKDLADGGKAYIGHVGVTEQRKGSALISA
jgi:hypothetical protein